MNLILLVQSTEEAADLNASIPGIKALGATALWLIHSPAVLVDLGASNAQIDSQIAAINSAVRDCVNREDYTGAEQYKQQRHALTLQKASAATEGYKTMSVEAQEAATKRVFGAFWEAKPAPRMQLSMHPQHHETRDWIEMLNSLKGRWPAEMAHGNFIVAWPGQFVGGVKTQTVEQIGKLVDLQNVTHTLVHADTKVPVAPPAEKKPRKVSSGYMGHPRFKQLCASGIDLLGETAIGYKINPNGMGRMKLVHVIGKHEEAQGLLDKAAV